MQTSTIVSLRRVNMTEYALTSRTATHVHVLRDTPASNVKLVRYIEHVTLSRWCMREYEWLVVICHLSDLAN